MTRVVHCKLEPYDILIDRTTRYGNPFVIGKDGDRNEVIDKFEIYARRKFTKAELLALDGKTLGCWCKHKNNPSPCHGDVYIKLINEIKNGEPKTMANTERQKAVEEAMKKPANHVTGGGGGRGNYAYVNVGLLERLGIQQYKPVPGDNFIRIINPKDLNLFWHQRIYVHRNIGANDLSFLCLKYMFNKPCPICEEAKRIKDANPKGYDKDEVKALYPKQRDLIFVVDISSEESAAKGVQWWDAPLFKYQTKEKPENSVASNFRALSKDPRTGITLDISDPTTGFDLYFKREGEGTDTTFSAYRLMEQAVNPPEWQEMVPQTYEEVLSIPVYEQVRAEFEGGAPGELEEGSEVETAPAGAATDAKTTAPAATTETAAPATTAPAAKSRFNRSTQQVAPEANAGTTNTGTANPPGQSVQDKIAAIRQRQEAARNAQQNKG